MIKATRTPAAAAIQWSPTTTRTPIATGWWMFLITLGVAAVFYQEDATVGAAVTG